jgi:hypothetical protein
MYYDANNMKKYNNSLLCGTSQIQQSWLNLPRVNRETLWIVPLSQQRCGAPGVLIFTVYVYLVAEMLHTKFQQNWNGSYQEVKNV